VQISKPVEVRAAQNQLQEIKSAGESWDSAVMFQKVVPLELITSSLPMAPPGGTLQNAFIVDGQVCVLSNTVAVMMWSLNGTDIPILDLSQSRDVLYKRPWALGESDSLGHPADCGDTALPMDSPSRIVAQTETR
jgi:hypothetical protein